MTNTQALNGRPAWRAFPAPDVFEGAGRWLLVAAVSAAMVTPRFSVGSVRLGVGDILTAGGAACWALTWVISGSRSAIFSVARWPVLALVAGVLSMTASSDIGASAKGLAQLVGLWILPSIAVATLFTTDDQRRRLLSAASAGALLAAIINFLAALRVGIGGGLPQVWGIAGGFQGYFQTIGLMVALPRLATALSTRRALVALAWSLAACLHAVALLLTQTRGAWLAALVAMLTLGLVWRGGMLVAACLGVVAGLAIGLSADWTGIIRERVQSVLHPEAQLSGFDSSVIRIGLALASWNMFLAHPFTGVGLKSFALALPLYAPTGLPLIVDMGPDLLPIPIEGPHSTLLSMLAETGVLGAVAVAGWIASAWWRAYRWNRALPVSDVSRRQIGATLPAAIAVIAVFNLFSEMNASGTIPLIVLLALGHQVATQAQPHARHG